MKINVLRSIWTILTKYSRPSLTINDIETKIIDYWEEAFVLLRCKYCKNYDKVIDDLKSQSIIQTIVPKNKGLNETWMEANLITL
jgi:5-methylcytosine-specific restriction endonuclease McrA